MRRFAIQQSRIRWGASAFAAVPSNQAGVTRSVGEQLALGRLPITGYGHSETRHDAGRGGENLWIYALPNPHPDKPIHCIRLTPQSEWALVYGITTTNVADHPLRPGCAKSYISPCLRGPSSTSSKN